ncbi:hypothetical protein LXL04_012403 [Taraxacum kok-saghyz]
MAAVSLLLTLTLITFTGDVISSTTPYLSPETLFSNYDKMLDSFKIFVYATPPITDGTIFTTTQESQFYTSLIQSPFVTEDPSQAHLYFVPFPSSLSTRNLARLIRNIRVSYPFWNRTLGADHFYLSATGVDSSSDRNIVELKKNSIQISCFPTSSGLFIPHKDITLPPVHPFQAKSSVNNTLEFLGFMKPSERSPSALIEDIKKHPEFMVESEPGNRTREYIRSSRFCLFVYGDDMTWMVEAMALRCVPVVITDRPIQDLPLMDTVKWSEIAVFVSSSGGAKGLRRVLDVIELSRYEQMKESGEAVTQHLAWNAEPQPHDAFHMVIYQLWLRRHTIRYARWVEQ